MNRLQTTLCGYTVQDIKYQEVKLAKSFNQGVGLTLEVIKLHKENAELKEFITKAFEAHPNLDMDIDKLEQNNETP